MTEKQAGPTFRGDPPIAAEQSMLRDRRELALVAIERTRMPMVVTDPRLHDNPVVYANQAFLDLTGYEVGEVLGRNCRFLQGEGTSARDVDAIRSGLQTGAHFIETELLNYRKDGTSFWNQLAISLVHDDAGEIIYYFASQKDVTARRQAQALEISERLLLKEVDHRALNALALVKSIVGLSRRATVEQFAGTVTGRVDALARAHRLLAQSNWVTVSLPELLAAELQADEAVLSGPSIRIASRLVQPLCLAIHELASNAREHGALLSKTGRLEISWEEVDGQLTLRWSESHITSPTEEARKPGLGLTLLRGIIEQQLAGRLSTEWTADRMMVQLSIPSQP